MHINDVSRGVTKTWLRVVRLPVDGAAAVLNRGDRESWGPSVAYEGFAASVKRAAGSITGDHALVEEGKLQQARVRKLRDAVELETRAEERRLEADAELRERREAAEQRQIEADQRARQQEQQLERQRAEEKQRAQAKAAEKSAAAARASASRKKVVEAQERAARETRVEAETEAVAEKRRAVEVRGQALDLENAIEANKERRQSRA